MQAIVFDGELAYREDYPPPRRREGESLVEVALAGICATDLEIARGYMGFRGVLGHEFVGRVVESGADRLVGARVVGEINCPCGACALCARGLGNHCASRSVLGIQGRDGAFARYLTLPDGNLHPVPEGVPDRAAVFAEPLAAACRAADQASLGPGERAVVLGDGRLGILVAKVLSASGAQVLLAGKHPAKLSVAARDGIPTATLDALEEGYAADVAIEATGAADGLEQAMRLVRPCGRIIMKTTVAAPHRLTLAPLVVNELTILGSRCGPFAKALGLLASKSVDPLPLVSAEYPLFRGLEAFEKAREGDALKVLLSVGP